MNLEKVLSPKTFNKPKTMFCMSTIKTAIEYSTILNKFNGINTFNGVLVTSKSTPVKLKQYY